MKGSKLCSPQKTFPTMCLSGGNILCPIDMVISSDITTSLHRHRKQILSEASTPYLGTVESVVQFVCELLLLLPGCLHQAGVHEGEGLHDLLHGKPRPGWLLLSLGRAEHLIMKKVKYPAVFSLLSPLSSLQFISKVAATIAIVLLYYRTQQ